MDFISGSKQRKLYLLKTNLFNSYTDTIFKIVYSNSINTNQTIKLKGVRRFFWGINGTEKPFLQKQTEGIYSINFNSLESSKKELKKSIKILQKEKNLKGIIIDFRSVRYMDDSFLGYFSKKTLNSPDWKVPVKTSPNKTKYYITNWKIKPKKKVFEVPIVFLIDASIISYGETVMGIVEQYKLGDIVGTNTAGCNGDVTRFQTPVYNVFAYTGMRVDNYDGTQLFNIGIKPTVYIENSAEDIINGVDRQLNKAIELINQK